MFCEFIYATVPLTLNLTTHASARHVFRNARNIFRVRTTDLCWKLHACMHETFILLACVACTARVHAQDVHELDASMRALCMSAKFSARKEHSCINCLHERV